MDVPPTNDLRIIEFLDSLGNYCWYRRDGCTQTCSNQERCPQMEGLLKTPQIVLLLGELSLSIPKTIAG
jgi:hypothetical protein